MQIGEFASDYIELRREYTDAVTPFDAASTDKEEQTTHEHVAAGDRHGHAELDASSKPDGDGQKTESIPEKQENGNAHD